MIGFYLEIRQNSPECIRLFDSADFSSQQGWVIDIDESTILAKVWKSAKILEWKRVAGRPVSGPLHQGFIHAHQNSLSASQVHNEFLFWSGLLEKFVYGVIDCLHT